MTLQTEPTVVRPQPAAAPVPRGGTYVTLPAGAEVPPAPQGSYVTLPGELPGNANKAQGTYVTLPSVPAGETEHSYTRVG